MTALAVAALPRRKVGEYQMGPYVIPVYEVDGLKEIGGDFGGFDYSNLCIEIDSSLRGVIRAETLNHERTHAAAELAGLELNETQVAALSLLTFQAVDKYLIAEGEPLSLGDLEVVAGVVKSSWIERWS